MSGLKRSILLASACVLLAAFSVYAQSTYPETINVMQSVLKGELGAHAKYAAYAEKAREERYMRLGYLATVFLARAIFLVY
jgi:hypothetical protein